MKRRIVISVSLILIIAVIIISIFFFHKNYNPIKDFESCIEAGYPVMESYPRQCFDGENIWTEELESLCVDNCGNGICEEIVCQGERCPCSENWETCLDCINPDYLEIAEDSECGQKGDLNSTYFYNDNSRTWWIDLNVYPEFAKSNCNPACVVSEENLTAEINWRCTGLLSE